MSEPNLAAINVAAVDTSYGSIDAAAEPRRGFSRREFLYLAGVGAATLALTDPAASALAAEAGAAAGTTASAADAAAAATTATTAADGRIIGWLHWDDGGDTATPFIFEPSFFKGSAMSYNAHLATFGCCLADSAINADPGGGSDHKYQNMYRNVRSLMKQIGVQDGDVTEYSYECDGSTITGHRAGNIVWNKCFDEEPAFSWKTKPKATIGLCVGHRKIKIDGQESNLVLLAVRGGNYEAEWCSNFVVGETGNHEGFQEAADMATTFLKCLVREYGLTGPTKVLICGHSRGGATANITAGNIVKHAIDNKATKLSDAEGYDLSGLFDNKITLRQCDLYCYGYAVPAGVFAESADAKKQARDNFRNIHNIINPCDMIPKFVPGKWDCMRYGVDKVLPGPANNSLYTAGREKMLDRLYALGLHRKNGHFGYQLDGFPAIDFEMLDGIGSYVEGMKDMPVLDVYLENFINGVATDVFHARVSAKIKRSFPFTETEVPGYAKRYQAAMVGIQDLYLKFDRDTEMNTKGADNKTPLEKFMSLAGNKITSHMASLYKTMYFSKPLVDIIDYVDEAMKGVKIKDGVTVNDRYGDQVRSILHALFDEEYRNMPKTGTPKSSLSKFIYNNLQDVIAFAQKAGVILSSHSSEMYLAWLQSRDTYYNKYGKADVPDAPADTTTSGTASAKTAALTSEGEAAGGAATALTDADEATASVKLTGASAAAGSATSAALASAIAASSTSENEAESASEAVAATAAVAEEISDTTTQPAVASESTALAAADESATASTAPASANESDTALAAALAAAGVTLAEDEYDDGAEDDDPTTYRKIVFNGGTGITGISYVMNGTSYQIFENGKSIKTDDGSNIAVEGAECPFQYGIDADLEQVIYLPDTPNAIDGTTTYRFTVTTEPGALLKFTAARYDFVDSFPESIFTYRSNAQGDGLDLASYDFTVAYDQVSGNAITADGEAGEGFSCSLDTAGVTWEDRGEGQTTDMDSGDDIAERYYYISARSANEDMGAAAGSGTCLRGTNALIEAQANDGYEFDYWTLDDKYLVNGVESTPIAVIDYSIDEDGNAVAGELETAAEGEWVEGERVEGEVYEGTNIYRATVDGNHLVTAHFKAASAAPAASETTTAAAAKESPASNAKTAPQTGDATPFAAAALAATAAAAAAGAVNKTKGHS